MSNLFHDVGSAARVMLATTAYDSPDASYTYSIARSREALHKAGLPTAYYLLSGNCHVDDARNTVVADFLESGCTDLVFIDADVSWEPADLVRLCEYDCDLVGGVYPYRRDTGREGMPVRNKAGCLVPDEDGLLEVEGLPTGFLRIRRHVLETLAADAETFSRNGKDIPLIFERDIYNGGRRGGDIHFCMKWLAKGGKAYAAANMRLGHVGKHIVRDSLAASLRRQAGGSLSYVAGRIRDGVETRDDYAEALKTIANPWGAEADFLELSVSLARKATGPVIEAGSGLTTVLMAAANPDITVWCLEHSQFYANQLEMMAVTAGVSNIAIVACPIRDGWYDISEDMDALPCKFSVGVIDGPPRAFGDRMRFFDVFGDRCKVMLADDANDDGYAAKLTTWAEANGRSVDCDWRTALILEAA